jgi:hypothetical protein
MKKIMNKEIKPTYVTFEQAKRLRDKGFNESCDKIYYLPHPTIAKKNNVEENIWFSINNSSPLLNGILRPEQHQVVEWLRVNHGIWIEVIETDLFQKYFFQLKRKDSSRLKDGDFNSPQEAYSAAFDYVLNNLL